MGFVKEEEEEKELDLGAGSLGLGFGRVAGDSRSSLQLQWQQGGDGYLLSSRGKPQHAADVANIGGGFLTTSGGLVISSWYTPDQWQELQRQAMIYKHLEASVPIPPDLLWGLWSTLPPSNPHIPVATALCANRIGGAGYHGGHALAAMDPEPGRCRRTDGKKWRCANEAAQGKRYCEKHLHRSRPRSRKPVERQHQLMPPHAPELASATATNHECSQQVHHEPLCPPPAANNEISSWDADRNKVKSEEETGNSGSCAKVTQEEMMRHLGHGKFKSEPQGQKQQDEKPPQVHQQHLDSACYPYASYHHDDSFFSLLNSDISSLNDRHLSFGAEPWSSAVPAAAETNKYIDFTRTGGTNNSVSAQSPPMSLLPEEPEEGLVTAGVNAGGDTKRPPFWWLPDALLTGSSPDAAAPFSITGEESGGVVAVTSPPDSAVASPTGVLQRPLASISDCSSNNSSEAFGGLGGGGGAETTTTGPHTWMMKP